MKFKLTRAEKKKLQAACLRYEVSYNSILKTLEERLTYKYFGGKPLYFGDDGGSGDIEKTVAMMSMED